MFEKNKYYNIIIFWIHFKYASNFSFKICKTEAQTCQLTDTYDDQSLSQARTFEYFMYFKEYWKPVTGDENLQQTSQCLIL